MAQNENAERRRAEILAAAEKVFDARGYAATTMEAVAELAGISKGSIYNYFDNKQDLFLKVFFERLGTGGPEVEQILATQTTAAEKLQLLVDGWFARLAEHERVGRLMLEFWATAAREDRSGRMPSSFRGLYSTWRQRLAEIIAQGQQSGQFSKDFDATAAAALIQAAVDGITIQSILQVGVNVDEEFVAALKRAIMAGLTVERPIKGVGSAGEDRKAGGQ